MDSQKEIKIKVLRASNGIYWYNKHINEIFIVRKFTSEAAWVNERNEYKCLNFVLHEDYEIIEE